MSAPIRGWDFGEVCGDLAWDPNGCMLPPPFDLETEVLRTRKPNGTGRRRAPVRMFSVSSPSGRKVYYRGSSYRSAHIACNELRRRGQVYVFACTGDA